MFPYTRRGSHNFNHDFDDANNRQVTPSGVVNIACLDNGPLSVSSGNSPESYRHSIDSESSVRRSANDTNVCVISNNGSTTTFVGVGNNFGQNRTNYERNGANFGNLNARNLQLLPTPTLPISSSSSSLNSSNNEPIRLTWEELSYEVFVKKWTKNLDKNSKFGLNFGQKIEQKVILKRQFGEVASGQLVGIIGPSGAGKSTLLNCLTGRYRDSGVHGSVYVTSAGLSSGKKKKRKFLSRAATDPNAAAQNDILNVAFIPQRDNLFGTFTVKETLIFASKMKNGGMDQSFHEDEANKVIKYLSLESCSKTYISKCSGGQVKRVCIGVELVSRPDILVLDEPTTGLDSSTAYQCVSILRKLVDVKDSPPAIIATIHQPSCKILKQFHAIYLLSKTGRCLYFGPPDGLKTHFSSAGLEFPLDYNPADFAIETAYGDYGEDIFDKLEEETLKSSVSLILASSLENNNSNISGNNSNISNGGNLQTNLAEISVNGKNGQLPNGPLKIRSLSKGSLDSGVGLDKIKITTIVKRMQEKPFSFLDHTKLLLMRNWMKIGRDPGQLWLRLFQNIAIGLMVSYLWNPGIGAEDGCWSDFLDAKSANATDAKNLYLNKISRINANSALLFSFLIYVVMVSVMSTVLSFPTETLVIIKEMKNNWYTCSTWYWAKFIAELPILFATIAVLAAIIYPLTGQIPVLWRFGILYLVTCMMGEVCQSIGMMFGTIFSDDLISACFSSVASGFPPILFGGFVVQVSQIRWYLKPFVYLSYLRYAFESCVIAIYGFNRCEKKIANNFVDRISKATNPVTLIGTLVSSFNLTSKDANSFSLLLGVDQACVEGVINGTIDYFGINKDPMPTSASESDYDNDYDMEDVMNSSVVTSTEKYYLPDAAPKVAPTEYEESSYVLSYYSLSEDVLIPNIATLILFMVIFKFITYYLLLRKARS